MIDLTWDDPPRDELADIWVTATPKERETIEPIVIKLERDLLAAPLSVGESREDPLRVAILLPLVVWFNVNLTQVRIVRVTRPQRK